MRHRPVYNIYNYKFARTSQPLSRQFDELLYLFGDFQLSIVKSLKHHSCDLFLLGP